MSGRLSDGCGARTVASSYRRYVLHRLDHLLTTAAPAATTPARQALLAHAVRHTLAECGRAGLAEVATARLRAAGSLHLPR